MTATKILLARLNTLRAAASLAPLKHAPSTSKMNDAIAALTPATTSRPTSFFADLCREYDVNPKVGRAYYRRHIGFVADFDETDKKLVARVRVMLQESATRKIAA